MTESEWTQSTGRWKCGVWRALWFLPSWNRRIGCNVAELDWNSVWKECFCLGRTFPEVANVRTTLSSLHKRYKHVEAAAREINKVRVEKIKTLSRNTEPSSFRTTSLRHIKHCVAITVNMMSTGNTCKDHMRSQICVKKERTRWFTHSLRVKERSPIN